MTKAYFLLLFILVQFGAFGQNFKVLHYTETSGFDHQTRQNSLAMFQTMGQQYGFTVDDDQTGTSFDSLSNLMQYEVVVFSNTSGDQILDSNQRANFESYIQSGGSLLGIHAASDTYRHSTANGNNTGKWDAYAELLGGSVQQSPNHTSANHNGIMDVVNPHSSVANVLNPWQKVEEYYYWENGYLNQNNQVVLEVRSTGSNSYDTIRPISWYKEMFTGARLFYTALGHANSNFTSDTLFQNHIRDALLWAAHHNISLPQQNEILGLSFYPNPASAYLKVELPNGQSSIDYQITDLNGKLLQTGNAQLNQNEAHINIEALPRGNYLFLITNNISSQTKTVLTFSKN